MMYVLASKKFAEPVAKALETKTPWELAKSTLLLTLTCWGLDWSWMGPLPELVVSSEYMTLSWNEMALDYPTDAEYPPTEKPDTRFE